MRLITLISLLFIIFASSACDSNSQKKIINGNSKIALFGKTMGTSYNIAIIHPEKLNIDKDLLQSNIDSLLKHLNQQVSTYIKESQISQFNQFKSTEWIVIDKEFYSILQAAHKISEISDGAYDATISPLIDLWGFGTKNLEKPPSETQVKSAMTNIGHQMLKFNSATHAIKKTNPNVRIDLSGIAKGYAVDIISNFLKDQGLENHLVEIGGELKANGFNQNNKKWRIAIEQPDLNINIAEHGIHITNQAIATSGDYRNYYIENGIRLSHIIDPKTGYPIAHKLASISVLHESAMYADGYATAILVLGETAGKVFAKEQNLDVFMVIRKNDKYEFWSNSRLTD